VAYRCYRPGLDGREQSRGPRSRAPTLPVRRRAITIDASELLALGKGANVADSYVFVSDGGRSRETIEAADSVPVGARLALTNETTAPIADVVDAVIGLGHGADSKVYTVGYTATLQAFGLPATALDGRADGDDWFALPEVVEQTLARLRAAAERIGPRLATLSSLDFVGSGASLASVKEAALLVRESARIITSAYETYQYLHGPMEPLTSSHSVVLFGEDREVRLARYLADRGIPTLLVTSDDVAEQDGLFVLRIPVAPPMSRAILQILPVQLVAGDVARIRGLKIDGFLYHQDGTKVGSSSEP
jgi:glucosamine--fructose-6-phosphate aminotransferase (isomerizing)